MFWIKNIKLLSERIDSNFEMSKTLQKQLNDTENKIEAIVEVLKSDRIDINTLIQLVKKSTKGRK